MEEKRLTRLEQREQRERRKFENIDEDALKYLKARPVLDELRKHYNERRITWQQYLTIRGQALNGNIDGATKGMRRLVKEVER